MTRPDWTTMIRSESMAPVLVPGDRVGIRKVDPRDLAPGDIVVFLDSDGFVPRLVVHRLVWAAGPSGARRYWTKGDASFRLDPPLRAESILGRVESLVTFGRRWSIDGARSRCNGLAIAAVLPAFVSIDVFVLRAIDLVVGAYVRMCAQAAAAPLNSLMVILTGRRALVTTCFREDGGEDRLRDEAPPDGYFGILSGDERWSGKIELGGDVFVPRGVTLRIAAGSSVAFSASSQWSGRPSGRSGGRCGFTVYGELLMEGEPSERIVLGGPGWGGVRLLPGSHASLNYCDVLGADDAAIDALACRVEIRGCRFDGGSTGLRLKSGTRVHLASCEMMNAKVAAVSAHPGSSLQIMECRFDRNGTGIDALGADVSLEGCIVSGSAAVGGRFTGGTVKIAASRFERNRDAGVLIVGGSRAELRGGGSSGNRTGLACNDAELIAEGWQSEGDEETGLDLARSRCRLQGVAVSGARCGVKVSGGFVRAQALEVRSCAVAARIHEGKLYWNGGSSRGCGIEIGPRASARIESTEISASPGYGIRVAGGELRADSLRLEGNGVAGALIEEGSRAELRGGGSSGNRVGLACKGAELNLKGWRSEGDEEIGLDLALSRCRLQDVAVSGSRCGMKVSGGFARAQALEVRSCAVAARIHEGKLHWNGGSSHGCGIEVGPRASARIERAEISGSSSHGVSVAGGELIADSVRIAQCAGAGVYAADGASVSLKDCLISGSQHGIGLVGSNSRLERVVIENTQGTGISLDGGSHDLKRVEFVHCREPMFRSLGTRMRWDEVEDRRPGLLREALVCIALATRHSTLLRPFYALIYALPALAVRAWARTDAAVVSLMAHRSWAAGKWLPGASDVDLILIADGLSDENGWEWLTGFSKKCARWKRFLPHLGEILVMDPEDFTGYLSSAGVRSSEISVQARVLHGRPLGEFTAGSSVPTELDYFVDSAHAYTRLMRWVFAPISATRSLMRVQATKALRELRIDADVSNPAALQRAAADAVLRLHVLASNTLRDGGAPIETAGRPVSAPAGCEADVRHFTENLDYLRSRLAGRLEAVCVDDFYRSYFIIGDEDLVPAAIAPLIESLQAYALERKGGGTLPIVMSRSAWTLWAQSPYLECPFLGEELAALPSGAPSVVSAGRSFLGSRRLYWSAEPFAGPRLDPEAATAAARRSLATFRATWRFHASMQSGQSPAYSLHYLHSRAMGLRLFVERGLSAPMYDIDALAELYRQAFPDEMGDWPGLWNGLPYRLDSQDMRAHYRWIGRQLRLPGGALR